MTTVHTFSLLQTERSYSLILIYSTGISFVSQGEIIFCQSLEIEIEIVIGAIEKTPKGLWKIKHYANINHVRIYPVVTAISVNGTPMDVKSLVFTS